MELAMRPAATCPDLEWWNDLLEGRCAAGEQAGPSAHLESCPACQKTLEQLTNADASWPDAARRLHERPVALRHTMAVLKEATDAGAETVELPTTVRTDVGFLRPSCDPLHLGRLGPYEVLEVIGRGGMGVVLKALDPGLGRVVAIKVLGPAWASHAAARRRFEREARATAAVRHEHVVAVYAVDEADGLPYLVMEHVPGLSLQQYVQRTGPLPVEEIARIGMETAAGLAAAHAQGLIHRDVKPANILLEGAARRVKLSDFGLARTFDDASLTQSGVIAGTPQYMAPEQAHGTAIDQRADLFSLGSVLYTLCTGQPPFAAATTMAVIKRVCDDMPRPIRASNPRIPVWLVELIARLHAKRPADRFASADEVSRLLGKYLHHLRAPRTTPAPPLPGRTRPWSSKWLLLVPLILVAASLPLIVCGSAAYSLFNFLPDQVPVVNANNEPGELQALAVDDPGFKTTVQKLDGDVFARMAGTKELAQIKPNEQQAEVAQKLANLAGFDDQFTRTGALRALGVWGTPKEVPALINALGHSDVFTRREALKVVGPFRDKRALPLVIRGFKEFQTREAAGVALRAMGPMAEKDVLTFLAGDDLFLKVDAIKVLKDIGTDASAPALNAAVASNNVFLVGPAREALAAIDARAKQ
jgi:serine/threonine protein kinase